MAQGRPVIALLTDFGLRDHYAGAMKGVILGIAPDVSLVDISHEVPAQDITAAAYELAAAYRSFPAGTIFVVVVDPGVGTARRAVAFEAGGYRFVGPDNGVFALVTASDVPGAIVELTEPAYARQPVSRTFEGRDRFAPAAAWLARGTELRAFGPLVPSLTPLAGTAPEARGPGVEGRVIRVDRFGNLITNIARSWLGADPSRARVTIAGRTIEGILPTYDASASGTLSAIVGSSGYLEVAVTRGSAEATLNVGRGAPVQVVPGTSA